MTGQRGFTLIELLLALATLGLVLVGVVLLQQQGQFAFVTGTARVESQQNARVALELFVREVRSARGVVAAAGCDDVTSGATDFSFQNQDGVVIRYRRNGTSLERTDGNGAATLIGGVQEFRVWCFQASGARTAVPASVRSVTIALATYPEDNPSYAPAHQVAMVESQVRLRNLP